MSRKGKEVDRTDDPRFSRLGNDPRFLKQAKKKQKVVVDARFKGLFEGDQSQGPSVDKYGRKIGKHKSRDELKRFYRLDDDQKEKSKASGKAGLVDFARGQVLMESSSEEETEEDSDSPEEEEVHVGKRQRRASSELSIDLEEDDLPIMSDDETDEVAPQAETNRLALVNLDWDHVRAIDIYKVLSSVLAPDAPPAASLPNRFLDDSAKANKQRLRIAKGHVVSVYIYPSEFGKKRMNRENLEGPPAQIFKPYASDHSDDEALEISEKTLFEENDGAEYDERALRKYQLERLRYFYAIAEFDSISAARHAFEEIDGTEFERTANFFELRMVPQDMTFDEQPHDSALADSISYKGVDFVTDALRHSRVKLTWDADDPLRQKLTRRDLSKVKEDELQDMDVTQYLASDSSEEEENISDPQITKRDALRKALGLDGRTKTNKSANRRPEGDMEITFAPAFAESNDNSGIETSLDAIQRKEREKRARKKAERAAKGSNMKEDIAVQGSSSQEEVFPGLADHLQDVEAEDKGFDDPFFASGSDGEPDSAMQGGRVQQPKDSISSKRRRENPAEEEAKARQRAELSLLVDSDSDQGVEGRHFDMREILKSEKQALKSKGKRKRKRPGKQGSALVMQPIQDTFQVNVGDERFKALHDDHRFAVDPTNPHYVKTRNTEKLLEESRRRRDIGQVSETSSEKYTRSTEPDLARLVAGIKRKAESHVAGKGRRAKKD